jgi:hypothetical protein
MIKAINTDFAAARQKLMTGIVIGGLAILVSVSSLLTAHRTGGFVLLYGFAIAGSALAIRSAVKLRRLAKARRQADGR